MGSLRQTMTTTRPPGRMTRRISRTAAVRSGKYWIPSWQITRSKLRSGKGRSCASAVRPAPCCQARRGHGDHRRVVIQSDDGSGRANALGDTVGDDSGAASHVQDRLPVLDLSRVEDYGHPGTEDRWHEVVGVDLRRASGKPPTLHITDSAPSWGIHGRGLLAAGWKRMFSRNYVPAPVRRPWLLSYCKRPGRGGVLLAARV